MSGEGRESEYHVINRDDLYRALLALADNLPPGLGGPLADPVDDGPVILAWGVNQLADAIIEKLAATDADWPESSS